MQLRSVFANRIVHVGLLAAAVLGVFLLVGDLPPTVQAVVLVLPVVTWYMGVVYERSVVIASGLVDEEELREAERDAASLLW